MEAAMQAMSRCAAPAALAGGVKMSASQSSATPLRAGAVGWRTSQLMFNSLSQKVQSNVGRVQMAKESPAAGYAAALVELARSKNALEAVHQDCEALSGLMNNAELFAFVTNPTVEDSKKKSILKTLASDGNFNTYTLNFLNLLVDKRRVSLLKDICVSVEDQYCRLTDTQVAVVTSAVKLENAQQALIAKKLQGMTGAKNIKLKNIVDPSLIAGFVVKFGKDGSRYIDLSVKGQLDRLASQFEYAAESV